MLATDDSPSQVFARTLAVLERDRFYDLAVDPTPALAQAGVVFEIAILRCLPAPRIVSVMFTAPPTPNTHTTVLRIVVPFGAKLRDTVDPDVVRLIGDVAHAVYQSRWNVTDIY